MRTSLRTIALLILLVTTAFPAVTNANFPAVKFVEIRSPVPHGGQGEVIIQTAPGTNSSISVIYKSGPSKAAGLQPQLADAKGMITWIWKVGTRTTPGTWPIIVECGQGEITRVRGSFTVT